MQKRKMWVEWEDGADLSQSRKKPGDYSPLTRDGDNNLGHVTLSDIDEDEDDWQTDPDDYSFSTDESEPDLQAEDVLAAAVVLAAFVAAHKAAPHLKRWWTDQAVPFMKRSKKRLSKRNRVQDDSAASEQVTSVVPAPIESAHEAVGALAEYGIAMSSAEAQERFVAALIARRFSDEQLRLLNNVRIDDGADLELAHAIEALTPQQLAESITLMLEASPTASGAETLEEFQRRLALQQVEAGREPARRAWPARALRLPRRE